MKTKNIYISLIALFLLAAMIFGGVWFYQSRDAVASEEAFNELEDMIVQPTENPTEPDADESVTGDEEIPEETTEPVDDEIAEALMAQAQYTIEGNSGDSCRERSYPLGYYEILGYGIPAY